jgi:hypothetical protein
VLRAFTHRDYRLFFAGQLISLIRRWMQSVAQSWLGHWMTGRAFLLGLVSLAGQLPVFVFSPVGWSASRER